VVEAPPTAPLPTCASPKPIKIQLFGDSTMWGYVPGGARGSVYPELALQLAMDAQFGTGHVSIETRAVNGTTTRHLLEGTDGLNGVWPSSVKADLIVINHGINDRGWGFTAATYKDNLRRLAVAPATIVFQTPLPTWSAKYLPAYLDQSFAPEMREVATELGIPIADANAYANSIKNWNMGYALDSVHPSAEGYQLLTRDVLAPSLVPLVAALRCSP
jgi:lysophospholipase L1-like esterase